MGRRAQLLHCRSRVVLNLERTRNNRKFRILRKLNADECLNRSRERMLD